MQAKYLTRVRWEFRMELSSTNYYKDYSLNECWKENIEIRTVPALQILFH